MQKQDNKELFNFIDNSPTSFHVINNIKKELISKEFLELEECGTWKIKENKKYFVIRNNSSIIAFKVPKGEYNGFNIVATHGDSPTFRMKDNPEINIEDKYLKLNTEKYGGMNISTWLDRPLSIAGRVMIQENNKLTTRLINIERDLLLIPSIAIHMNREINNGYKYNEQKDVLPLFANYIKKQQLEDVISNELDIEREKILSFDLFLYNREKAILWGKNKEFISAPRLDNLQCTYAALKGFLEKSNNKSMPLFVVFDNEEVGSSTKQGAASTFLEDTLKRILISQEANEEEYYKKLALSFMLSADGAHALHPNYIEKADLTNKPVLNGGVVIKNNASQKYTSDAVSMAFFKMICKKNKVPYQLYYNRSDIPGGSTLGNISAGKVSINTVDIGAAQLAMHSAYETAGVKDTDALINAIKGFYEVSIKNIKQGEFEIE